MPSSSKAAAAWPSSAHCRKAKLNNNRFSSGERNKTVTTEKMINGKRTRLAVKRNCLVYALALLLFSFSCKANDISVEEQVAAIKQATASLVGTEWDKCSIELKLDFLEGFVQAGVPNEVVLALAEELLVESANGPQIQNKGNHNTPDIKQPLPGNSNERSSNVAPPPIVASPVSPIIGGGVSSHYQPTEQLGDPGMWFPDYNEYHPKGVVFDPAFNDPEVIRAAETSRKASRYFTERQAAQLDERRADLEARRIHNEDMRQKHELEIDRITGTTQAERKTMAEHNLEEVSHKGAYGNADPIKIDRNTGELYRVNPDGSMRKIYINGVPARLDR